MNTWQQKALEILPELQSEILESENPMQFWLEIIFLFDEAYEEPRNEDLIRRIYDYEEWCLTQDEGETAANHLPTCVVIVFWEHIPTNTAARQDMPRWFSIEEILANQEAFRYSLTDENFKYLVDIYSKTDLTLMR